MAHFWNLVTGVVYGSRSTLCSQSDVRFFKKGKLLKNYSPLLAISDAATFVRNYLQKHGYKGKVFVLTYSPAHPSSVCPKAVAPWATSRGDGDYLAVTNTLYKVQCTAFCAPCSHF